MIKIKNNFRGLLGVSFIISLILFITPPAEALFGFFEKEPVDEYSKYIGIDENTLSAEEQNRLNKIRENLYHKEKTEFHFISRKYPTLKVFNEFPSNDSEGWIEYATENYKKDEKVSKTDSLADIPQNATDKWIEYLGENKGRSYYKTHNLNQTDFWGMDIPPTKEDTKEMASYDPYKVVKYYPQIEQAYYDTPVFWDKAEFDNICPYRNQAKEEKYWAEHPERDNGARRIRDERYWETNKRSEKNKILCFNYPDKINGFSVQYYKPQSMQKEQTKKRATEKFNKLFYDTLDYDKHLIDYKFEESIFNIRQQRVGYIYTDFYGGEYYRNFGQWANDWALAGTGATEGKYVGGAKGVQNYVDTNDNLHYRILTEEDMKFISEIEGKPISTPTPTPEPTPKITPEPTPTLIPTPTISPATEELIRKSVSNETIPFNLLNETAKTNESIYDNAISVDNETFANLTDFLADPFDTLFPAETEEDTEEIVEVITEEPEVEEELIAKEKPEISSEPEDLSEPKDNTPFGIAKQRALNRPAVEGDWERKIIKSGDAIVLWWENSKQRKTKIRYLTPAMANRLTDYELETFSDPNHTKGGDITAWTKEGNEGIDAFKQEKYFSEESKRLNEDIIVSHNYDIETGKVLQIFIRFSDKNVVEVDFEKEEIYFPSHN